MKSIILSLVLVGALSAELPRFRPARFRFQRQELAPTTTDSPTEATTDSAPYPASGWKPAGEPFTLPNEPDNTYGSPQVSTEAPQDTYGAPVNEGPYPASGWKPAGEPFTLPNEVPENTYGAPQESTDAPEDTYGAPKEGPYPPSGWKPSEPFELPQPTSTYGVPDNTYGAPEVSTTEIPTTDNPQAERLEGPVKVQKSVGTYFVVLPNGQLQKVEFVTDNDVQNMRYTASLQYRERAPLIIFSP